MTDIQQLLQIASVLSESGATREQIIQAIEEANGPQPQRPLTEDERDVFAGAIARAVDIMPAFRDGIALIRPFRDHTTDTLYTDKFSRVGIGAMFFLPTVSSHRRATLLLHEAFHVLNNHFTRRVEFPIDADSDNRAKDLEINSLLNRHPKADLSMLLLPQQEPYKFPEIKSYEQYATFMRDKGMLSNPTGAPQSQPQPSQNGAKPEGSPENGPSGSDQSADADKSDSSEQTASKEGAEKGEGSESSESLSSSSEAQDQSSQDQDGGEENDQQGESGSQDSESEGSEGDQDKDDESEGNSSGKASGSSSKSSSPEAIADEALEKSSSSDGSANSESKPGTSCDRSTSEREQIADDLGIEKASSTEQAVARNNTMARVREEAAKSKERGDRGALLMLQKMELAMEPSKINWRVIFRNIISNCRDSISMGRSDHSYRRVNKRLSYGEFIFPGMIRYEPITLMGIDTSGSMREKDFAFLLSEMETIIKTTLRAKDKFRAFCVDGAATLPKTVKSIRDIDLRGGGGTRMEVALQVIELLPKKEVPDIFVLATDGGTSWPAFKKQLLKSKHKFRTVVLISQEQYYEEAKTQLKGLADVIDISEKGTGVIGY